MAPFRFEPISAAPYTEKQGAIWGKTVGDLGNVAAQAYEGFAKRASDNEFKTTLFGELKQRYGEDPILSKQIANNEQKIMQMPRAEAEAAIASWAMQAETFKSTKELYPEAKLVAPVGFIPDAQVGYYNMLKGVVDKYSGDATAAKKEASRAAVSEGLKGYDATKQTPQGLGRSLALDPNVPISDAADAMKFAELPPEPVKMSSSDAVAHRRVSSDENEDKMKRFDELAKEAAGIRSQMTNVEAAENRIQSKGTSIEAILSDPNATEEDKADAKTIKDATNSRAQLDMLDNALRMADSDDRKQEPSFYLKKFRDHKYNFAQVKKEYETKNGVGAFSKLQKENPKEAYRLVAQYKQNPAAGANPAKENPTKSTFIEGKKYKDKHGNIAIFKNGKMQPL